MNVVIDTNVTISANGRDTHACYECQLKCIEKLQEIVSMPGKIIVHLDDAGFILSEYKSYLNFNGQPGVGDIFYKFLHDRMYGDGVNLISVTPIDDQARGFEELPDNPIDRSDRVFLAVALKSKSKIFNALDTDWHEKKNFIDGLQVEVVQICPEHGCDI